jgi:serine/threonine protein kinase
MKRRDSKIPNNLRNNDIGDKLAMSLSDFKILKVLGRGGFSTVYQAKHHKNKLIYALKCIKKVSKDKRGIYRNKTSMIHHEINILLKLNHPNIIRLFDWFEDRDNIYLVLEYITGKDLDCFFNRELATEKHAIHIIVQISNAIKHCHDNNVIHRDIKTGNILVDENLNVKLTDFGLSTIKSHPMDIFFDNVGTAYYISPELLLKKGYNEKVDTWALGITIYYLLTGQYPFKDMKRKDIFRKIRKNSVNYDTYILKEDQINLLKNLLIKDPHKRFNIDDVLNHNWLNKYDSQKFILKE